MFAVRKVNISLIIICVFIIILMICTFNIMQLKGNNIWVLLVAGSKSYMNYRHQADICRAYHLFKKNGIPAERIVVMMADDIAFSAQNPTQGVIINSPYGSNCYENIEINFRGADVNVKNFINVLLGNEAGVQHVEGSKVINSGPNDHIFINFVDHGGAGFLGFPNDLLHAVDFYTLLSEMIEKRKFSKMVMFVEASFGGSMFEEILQQFDGVYVVSSSDPNEASNACYYDETRKTYLADWFSTNWMKHIERDALGMLSLHSLYQKVRTETRQSHVEQYGDFSVGALKVSQFVGFNEEIIEYEMYSEPEDIVANPSVPVALIEQKLQSTVDLDKKNSFKDEMKSLFQKRSLIDNVLQRIAYEIVEDGDHAQLDLIQNGKFSVNKNNMHCLRGAIDTFSSHCFSVSQNLYARTVSFMFVNMCSVKFTDAKSIKEAIRRACSGHFPEINDIYR